MPKKLLDVALGCRGAAVAWSEATMTRLTWAQWQAVLGGLRRMQGSRRQSVQLPSQVEAPISSCHEHHLLLDESGF